MRTLSFNLSRYLLIEILRETLTCDVVILDGDFSPVSNQHSVAEDEGLGSEEVLLAMMPQCSPQPVMETRAS